MTEKAFKLRINNYDVPYGRIRSGIQKNNSRMELDDSDNELEQKLATLDAMKRRTQPLVPPPLREPVALKVPQKKEAVIVDVPKVKEEIVVEL